MTVFTLGYEGLDASTFMSLLTEHHIETVVDIRALPLSRKPGFSKKALSCRLHLSGRQYVHMNALGCPKPIREGYRADRNWRRYCEGFLKYLATQQEAIAELAARVVSSSCVLLCYEVDYHFCHRSMVADALKQGTSISVTHIQSTNTKIAHTAERQWALA